MEMMSKPKTPFLPKIEQTVQLSFAAIQSNNNEEIEGLFLSNFHCTSHKWIR